MSLRSDFIMKFNAKTKVEHVLYRITYKMLKNHHKKRLHSILLDFIVEVENFPILSG